MAAPTINTDYPARWHSPRGGARPLAIIAHGTVGVDSRRYLQRGGDRADGSDRQVSIHVLIQKDGTIYRMVRDEDAAHHAGGIRRPDGTLSSRMSINGTVYRGHAVNTHSLGFELENLQNLKDPYPDAQLLALGWQINQWRQRWGPIPVIRHATIDPGRRTDTVGLSVAQIELWAVRAAEAAARKHYTVKATAGANVRSGRSTSARVIQVLGPGTAWTGFETRGQKITIAGFGSTDLWVCDTDGRCVWRGLLDEVDA